MNIKLKLNFSGCHLLGYVDEVTRTEIIRCHWLLPLPTSIPSLLQNPLSTQGLLAAPVGILHFSRTDESPNSVVVPSLMTIA